MSTLTAPARTITPIPTARLVHVEARKSFDTRSGFWLIASIGILATLATAAVILFAPDSEVDFEAFASAIGFPMAIVLPMVAILSVTSEWSQRTGLTSYTLVPHRGRVLRAKAIVAGIVGVVSMVLALGIGGLGNVVGSAINGTDLVWNISAQEFALIVLGNLIGMAVGFMLGVLIRNSPGAIVAYFVYSLVLPTVTLVLGETQKWFADKQAWIDFNFAQGPLFEGSVSGQQWAQLAVTGAVWLVLPLTIGIWAVLRSEVK
ncbi:ABC transporter permease subunit [Nocardioides lianchengensis]|uniref:ABC-2 family transporter protein n=1 Tax=Nocardioides lianchengensis TaxID=1045774 RepID=A0A1G6KXD7_9ACTN|nr:ABC transporter permease subunit [Nocardioides lianchengensis]NYG13726.1 hypothetical protein [Nocardioides lianchengensis]SDC35478.1 ABC-2 family transporter protein [Nocardioides lianchengensis]